MESRTSHLRDRLVVAYSPLAEYAVIWGGTLMAGVLNHEDLMSSGA